MMNSSHNHTRISKFLSLVLRHRPEEIGLALDHKGWADVDDLIRRMNNTGFDVHRTQVMDIVERGPKNRFERHPDGTKIRARYGHSTDVDLGYSPQEPPPTLFHGTARRFLDRIRREGLTPRGRNYVHLSLTSDEARRVGARHGKPVLLRIDARKMHHDGYKLFQATDRLWLVKAVPPLYLHTPG